MAVAKKIGIQVAPPKKGCDDKDCPFHASLPVRKKTIEGRVVSAKMHKTVVIQKDYAHYIPRYLRSERRRSKIPAHNPPCISAKVGDIVRIAECRPLSKTVSFVIVEKVSSSGD